MAGGEAPFCSEAASLANGSDVSHYRLAANPPVMGLGPASGCFTEVDLCECRSAESHVRRDAGRLRDTDCHRVWRNPSDVRPCHPQGVPAGPSHVMRPYFGTLMHMVFLAPLMFFCRSLSCVMWLNVEKCTNNANAIFITM